MQIPLLIVGLPREPDVSINTSKVNFGQLGCGQQKQIEITLLNRESQSFNYRLQPDRNRLFEVKITPTEGIIPANGSTQVQLVCQPKTEGKISEVVQFEIAKKSIPLQLNVKYECYKAKHTLELLPENPLTGLV